MNRGTAVLLAACLAACARDKPNDFVVEPALVDGTISVGDTATPDPTPSTDPDPATDTVPVRDTATCRGGDTGTCPPVTTTDTGRPPTMTDTGPATLKDTARPNATDTGRCNTAGRPLRDADGARCRPEPVADLGRPCATYWAEQARDEHLSVTAFRRFARQLRELGAPADLIARADAAVHDEEVHAASASAIARQLGGGELRLLPVPVPEERPAELVRFAMETFLDGCCNETLSTAVALAQRAHATHERVVAHLDEVVADETEHAALAWATVRWALQVGGDEVRAALAEHAARYQVPRAARVRSPAPALGYLGAERTQQALDEAYRDVVLPCVRALLAA